MVLARKDVCSEEVVVNLPEIAGKVLSEAMREASRRPTIQEIMAHNRQVLQILERRPTFPAVSQDHRPPWKQTRTDPTKKVNLCVHGPTFPRSKFPRFLAVMPSQCF